MQKCSVIDCDKNIWEHSKVSACEYHDETITSELKQEHAEYLQERWDDYNAEIRKGINAGNMFRNY